MKEALIGLLLLGAILMAYILFVPQKPVLYSDTYYGQLKTACTNTTDAACCTESVQRMEADGFRLAVYPPSRNTPTCADGESVEELKCISSYRWCAKTTTGTTPAASEIFFEGQVRNGQTIPLPDGKTLNVRLGSRCGPEGDGNGGCSFGGYELDITLKDEQGNPVLNTARSMTNEREENTDYARFGIRIRLESFDASGDELTARIRVTRPDDTGLQTPEVADAPVSAVLKKDETTSACGKQIRYSGIVRAPGTRSDWGHSFDLIGPDGTIRESMSSFGTGGHKMTSQTTGITILVNRIEQTEPYTASIVIDCGI